MQQCGYVSSSPSLKPTHVENLDAQVEKLSTNKNHKDGYKIQQISAGTSHSIAWTTPPSKPRPLPQKVNFCIDVTGSCFNELKLLIQSCQDMNFLSPSIRLLCIHLFLTKDLAHGKMIDENLENGEKSLRDVIFDVLNLQGLDEDDRELLTKAVEESAWFLFPPLNKRLEIILTAIKSLAKELQTNDLNKPIARGSMSRCRCALMSICNRLDIHQLCLEILAGNKTAQVTADSIINVHMISLIDMVQGVRYPKSSLITGLLELVYKISNSLIRTTIIVNNSRQQGITILDKVTAVLSLFLVKEIPYLLLEPFLEKSSHLCMG